MNIKEKKKKGPCLSYEMLRHTNTSMLQKFFCLWTATIGVNGWGTDWKEKMA